MKNRALLSAWVLCFAAVGCDSQKAAEPPKPKTAAVVTPMPAEAPRAPAASAKQDAPAQVAQMAPAGLNHMQGCGHGRCKVRLEVTGEGKTCVVTATPDVLGVFHLNKGDDIKWSIATAGWQFVDTPSVQGIEIVANTNNQFTAPAGGNTNNYKWTNANTDTTKYKYRIHLKNGAKTCDADPMIVNGADEESPPA